MARRILTKERIQGLIVGAMLAALIYFGIIKPEQYMLTLFLAAGALLEFLMMLGVIQIRSRWMHIVSGFLATYGLLGFLPHA